MAKGYEVSIVDDEDSAMLQPIIKKDDLCLFEVEGGYAFFKRGEGRINILITEDQLGRVLERLRSEGWTDVDLEAKDDEED